MSQFEDADIIITPDPNDIQDFTTIYNIVAKDPSISIQAGSDKSVEKVEVSGVGEVNLPVTETSYLFITLVGITSYTFNCAINNISINNMSKYFDILDNGAQFKKANSTAAIYYICL